MGMTVHHPGRAIRRGLAAAALGAAMAALVSGCSPANYPAVLAYPTPRDDPQLTPDQIKQATDNLITDRNQLSTQAQAAQAAGADLGPPPAATPAKP